jgi:hypothetical protein
MPARRIRAWYFPWVPLGIAAAVTAGIVALVLFYPSTPQAQAAPATPQAVAAFQTTEKILLNVNLAQDPKAAVNGSLTVELLGPEKQVLDRSTKDVQATGGVQGIPFEFPVPKVGVDRLSVRCKFGEKSVEVPLPQILLVKAHETAVSSGQEFFAGSSATLRARVRGVKSSVETVPLPGSSVTVRLVSKEGKAEELFSGKAGDDGTALASFRVPALPAGTYTLEVATRSTLGEETLKKEVRVKTSPKVLLVTDKPLYQPGQVIHLRAMALNSFDLKPLADRALTFEVEDLRVRHRRGGLRSRR